MLVHKYNIFCAGEKLLFDKSEYSIYLLFVGNLFSYPYIIFVRSFCRSSATSCDVTNFVLVVAKKIISLFLFIQLICLTAALNTLLHLFLVTAFPIFLGATKASRGVFCVERKQMRTVCAFKRAPSLKTF